MTQGRPARVGGAYYALGDNELALSDAVEKLQQFKSLGQGLPNAYHWNFYHTVLVEKYMTLASMLYRLDTAGPEVFKMALRLGHASFCLWSPRHYTDIELQAGFITMCIAIALKYYDEEYEIRYMSEELYNKVWCVADDVQVTCDLLMSSTDGCTMEKDSWIKITHYILCCIQYNLVRLDESRMDKLRCVHCGIEVTDNPIITTFAPVQACICRHCQYGSNYMEMDNSPVTPEV